MAKQKHGRPLANWKTCHLATTNGSRHDNKSGHEGLLTLVSKKVNSDKTIKAIDLIFL